MPNWSSILKLFSGENLETFFDKSSLPELEKVLDEWVKPSGQFTTTTTTVTLTHDAKQEIERLRENLDRKISRFERRLKDFLEIGIWKVRKEIKLSSETPELQNLLVSLNREEISIDSHIKRCYTKEEFEEQKEKHLSLKLLIENVRTKIRSEIKLRENRSEKRKMMFILED
jgi:hypothetical protein